MADFEPLGVFRFDVGRLDSFHLGVGWAKAQPVQHRLDGVRIALEMRLNRAVRAVAHPSGDPKFACTLERRLPKEHSLHAAGDDGMLGNAIHD